MCKEEVLSAKSTKIYTRKELVMIETKISDFHISFYIPDIQKLSFNLHHVRILVTNHCGEMRCTAFKRRKLFQDVLCCRDYSERVVARFSHKIESKCYRGYISVSIEGIGTFECVYQRQISIKLHHHINFMQCFTIFLSDDSKQYSDTITARSECLILLLKDKTVLTTYLNKIWRNTDGCAEHNRCASALYLMSIMSQCYSIMIDQGISAPWHGKEVVHELNDNDKHYIYQLMYNVQLPVSNRFDSQMQIHNINQNNDVSLAKEFQQHLKKEH